MLVRTTILSLLIMGVTPSFASEERKTSVWIDCDPSVGLAAADVDDGFALLQALRSPELDIIGISSSYGNAPLTEAHPIAQKLTKRFGSSKVVHKGAARAGDFSRKTAASRAIIAFFSTNQGYALLLGPATNFAAALQQRPAISRNILGFIAVAGRKPGERLRPGPKKRTVRDLNFELDTAAFQRILSSGVPMTLAPFALSIDFRIDRMLLEYWKDKGCKEILGLLPAAKVWLVSWRLAYGINSFQPFDCLAVAFLTHPKLFTAMRMNALIQRGQLLLKAHKSKDSTKLTVLTKVSPTLKAIFKDAFVDEAGIHSDSTSPHNS